MADCECLGGCPFFNDRMAGMEATAAMMKRKYCLGDSTQCARYMVFKKLGKPAVPSDLFPSMTDRATAILAAAA